jgi:hypothetical protein
MPGCVPRASVFQGLYLHFFILFTASWGNSLSHPLWEWRNWGTGSKPLPEVNTCKMWSQSLFPAVLFFRQVLWDRKGHNTSPPNISFSLVNLFHVHISLFLRQLFGSISCTFAPQCSLSTSLTWWLCGEVCQLYHAVPAFSESLEDLDVRGLGESEDI